MRNSHMKEILKNYIINNYKEYILVGILFIIGLFSGVLIVNNAKESQILEFSGYISNFITKFKSIEDINKSTILITSIKNNIFLALIIWGAGTTVIGMPIVLTVIIFRGLILGYTISALTITLGTFKGIMFCLVSLFLQNLLFIPVILTLGVSSIKLYKSIIKDRRKENIKVEIIKHTIIFILMTGLLILSSLIENFISISILKKFIKYF